MNPAPVRSNAVAWIIIVCGLVILFGSGAFGSLTSGAVASGITMAALATAFAVAGAIRKRRPTALYRSIEGWDAVALLGTVIAVTVAALLVIYFAGGMTFLR